MQRKPEQLLLQPMDEILSNLQTAIAVTKERALQYIMQPKHGQGGLVGLQADQIFEALGAQIYELRMLSEQMRKGQAA